MFKHFYANIASQFIHIQIFLALVFKVANFDLSKLNEGCARNTPMYLMHVFLSKLKILVRVTFLVDVI